MSEVPGNPKSISALSDPIMVTHSQKQGVPFQKGGQFHLRGMSVDYSFPSPRLCHVAKPTAEASLGLFQVTRCVQDKTCTRDIHSSLSRQNFFVIGRLVLRGRLWLKAFKQKSCRRNAIDGPTSEDGKGFPRNFLHVFIKHEEDMFFRLCQDGLGSAVALERRQRRLDVDNELGNQSSEWNVSLQQRMTNLLDIQLCQSHGDTVIKIQVEQIIDQILDLLLIRLAREAGKAFHN